MKYVLVLALIGGLARSAVAEDAIALDAGVADTSPDPPSPDAPSSDTSSPDASRLDAPVAATATPEVTAPMAIEGEQPQNGHAKLYATIGVAGVYGAIGTWAYFAWFHGAHMKPFFFVSSWNEEKLGLKTYAGGADKFGHLWSNYALTRGTTQILLAGGWKRLPSSLVAAALSSTAFTLSEIKDGYVWGFEIGDEIANIAGAALAVLMENVPVIDRLFDFRLQYFPSFDYRELVRARPWARGDGIDIAQDYTGQSYMLALHLKEVPRLTDSPWTGWLKYADAVVGFEAKNYEPIPVVRSRDNNPNQTVYVGITLNMQHVLDRLFCDCTGRRIGHGVFEVFNLPYSTLNVGTTRTWEIVPN